jgi:type VI secretion system protein ImpH
MATESGNPNTPLIANEVAKRLHDEPFCFEFFQAVRLLEQLYPHRKAIGEGANAREEVVQFKANPTLSFPASDIQSLTKSEEHLAMTVNFMGLIGPSGALPVAYTEMVLGEIAAARLERTTPALPDFLDIFHHRAISLFYLAWLRGHFRLTESAKELDRFSRYLLSIAGLGTPGLEEPKRVPKLEEGQDDPGPKERKEVPYGALTYFAGLASQFPRSASALKQMLRGYFQVEVEIEEFMGGWYRLEDDNLCRLGFDAHESCRLAKGATVGDEVWEPQARVRIVVGPLSLAQYLDFLPGGSALRELRAFTRYFAGGEIDFEVKLVLDRAQAPLCRLGEDGPKAARLGWVTWAQSRSIDRDPGDTILQL